ncbi:hypothetical protein GCM10017714_31470 [Curtobacterium pusillum]|nr:hypothetical protein GCM10017610_21040 [Curtobacterium pusillum]
MPPVRIAPYQTSLQSGREAAEHDSHTYQGESQRSKEAHWQTAVSLRSLITVEEPDLPREELAPLFRVCCEDHADQDESASDDPQRPSCFHSRPLPLVSDSSILAAAPSACPCLTERSSRGHAASAVSAPDHRGLSLRRREIGRSRAWTSPSAAEPGAPGQSDAAAG